MIRENGCTGRRSRSRRSRLHRPNRLNHASHLLQEMQYEIRSFEVDPLLCVCGAEMKIVSIITDPRVVDRILRHLESQACRARDPFEPRAPPPEAIPSHEFQRRPLEHSANLDPELRTLHVCPSGAPNVARIRWGERIFQKRFLEPAFRPAKPDLIAQQGSHLRWPLETFRCIRDRISYSFGVRESLADVLGLVRDNGAI